jgi:hypothetical protein
VHGNPINTVRGVKKGTVQRVLWRLCFDALLNRIYSVNTRISPYVIHALYVYIVLKTVVWCMCGVTWCVGTVERTRECGVIV